MTYGQKTEHSFLNLLRFVAAFWVLVFHAQGHFGSIPSLSMIEPVIGQGVIAMTLFFMLSGFVLSMRYRDFTSDGAFAEFFAARIARLYPVYLFMGLITIWSIPNSFDVFVLPTMGLFASVLWTVLVVVFFILVLQAWFPSLFSVWNFGGSWSLSVEAFFYMVFPFIRTRLTALRHSALMFWFVLCPVLSALIAVGLLVDLKQTGGASTVFYVVPIYRLPEFLFGCLVFVVAVERSIWSRSFTIIALCAGFVGVFLIYFLGNLPGNLDYGFLFMPIFGLALFWSLGRSFPPLTERAANYLGHISYCLYIVQFGTVPVFKRLLDGQDVAYKWMIFIITNFILAILVYHFVEKVAYRRTRLIAKRALSGSRSFLS